MHRPEFRLRGAAPFAPLSPDQFAGFREGAKAYLRARADQIRPVDVELAAAVITRAVEALVFGVSRDEPHWLSHPAFLEGVTELVVGYLAPRGDSRP